MSNTQKITRGLLHLIPWVILLIGPFSSVFSDPEITTAIQIRAVIIFLILIGSFYLNYLVLIPLLLLKSKFTAYIVSVLLMMVGLGAFNAMFNWTLGDLEMFRFAPAAVMMLTIFGVAARMTNRWMSQSAANKEIVLEKLNTELAFLKNQISPHFLFNTLNNIYSLTETNPEKAREVTHGLSKLLRYLLYESEKHKMVMLGREVAFLNTYIELMKIRLPENVEVNFDHGSELDNTELPPLLFIPFVENAFKHGISLQEDCTVKISLQRVGENIEFSVINLIPAHKESDGVSGGLGLINIKRRLELLFGNDGYELNIHENELAYDVQLKIPARVN
jgi:LytS/YehU family sensor histidine kinase